MKKIFFLLAMLTSVATSAQVTNVEPVSVNYTDKTVSFRVWWNAGSRDATHFSKVWVWIDYITVNSNNTTSSNSWTRTTVGTVSGGTTAFDGSYRNGFWLEGNASTNYSATLTVQLTNVPAKFNWCAYVSDYPPNVTATNGTYTFRGTPPFTLIASGGATQTVSGTTLTASALTVTPTTIRDKTDCPGVFCPYQGSDLYIDATHLCQQRTSGAKNWEAWIKDERDNKIYRITQFSDNSWWMAEDMNNANKVAYVCSGKNLYSPLNMPDCPSQWVMPTMAKIKQRWPNGHGTDTYGADWETSPYVYGGCGGKAVQCYTTSGGTGALFVVVSDCNVCYHMYYGTNEWVYHCSAFMTC